MTTRLSPSTYLDYFDSEAAALLEASGEPVLLVPGCPGWQVSDLLSHVLGVYRHKIEALDSDQRPVMDGHPWLDWGDVPDGEDARTTLRETQAALSAELRRRDPAQPCWTFWPPEQTVAFWQRRMALETTVHRWDAQSAHGLSAADPIPADLAADGIDELLGWLERPYDDDLQPEADGHTVEVAVDGFAWTLSLHPGAVVVDREASDAMARISGPASAILLSFWGRPGAAGIDSEGDAQALSLLRRRLTR